MSLAHHQSPNTMTTETIYSRLNTMARADFIKNFGAIYEHSPWVAEQTYDQIIAAKEINTPEKLSSIMHKTVMDASQEQQLALLGAHPPLAASRLDELSQASQAEQRGAGLADADKQLTAAINEGNQEYQNRFGFPFIIAVAGKTPPEIYQAMQKRLTNTRAQEFATALEQVRLIALIRLRQLS